MKLLRSSAVAAAILLSSNTYAGQWSVGGMIGQSDFGGISDACFGGACDNVDDSDTFAGINIAYAFSKSWGIELGYMDFGTASITNDRQTSIPFLDRSINLNFSTNAELDASAVYIAIKGRTYLTEKWSLSGRIGVGSLDVEAKATASGFGTTLATAGLSEKEEELLAGLSIDYNFTDSFSTGLRYDDIDDASAISLNLLYSFGE